MIGREYIERKLRPLWARVRLMVQPALVTGTNDGQGVQHVTVAGLDTLEDDVEHYQPGGISHNCGSGEGIMLNGQGGTLVACVSSRTGRPKDIKEGETVLYSLHDCTIKLNEDGEIVITSKEGATITLDQAGDVIVEPKAGGHWKIGGAAAEAIVTADKLHTYLTALFASGAPVVMDGGAALKAAWTAYLAANAATNFSSTKGQAE